MAVRLAAVAVLGAALAGATVDAARVTTTKPFRYRRGNRR